MARQSMQFWVYCVLGLAGLLGCAASPAFAFPIKVAQAPDNNLSLTVSAIQSARQSILMNIYELSSSDIADALLERIRAGVHVEILEEGQPVGGLSAASRGVQSQLLQAMRAAANGDRLFEMSGAHGTRRFNFDHAKYAVIDGQSLLIGSENYSPSGNPVPGTVGNRGWEVEMQEPGIVQAYAAVFESDKDTSHGDVVELTSGAGGTVGAPIAPAGPAQPADSVPTLEASAVARITSPDTSLSGLQALIDGAASSVDVELMTFDSAWRGAARSPLVDSLIAAARRGVRVRVLLNDESVFNHNGGGRSNPKNQPTADLLNQAASQESLPLTAVIANVRAMGVDYIHDKGMLVDSDITLISSINWDQNSIMRNREAAVAITSPDVHAHYEALFEKDWEASGGRPAVNSPSAPGGVDPATVRAPAPLPPSSGSFSCPDRLKVSASVGALDLTDPEDQDFASIQGKTLEGVYNRSLDDRGCVLELETGRHGGNSALGESRFIQIRARADGTLGFSLEGYTPRGLIYSIRANLADPAALAGASAASVYDASGPSRRKLGEAELNIGVSP